MYDLSFRRQAELAKQQIQDALLVAKKPMQGAPPQAAPQGAPPQGPPTPPQGGMSQAQPNQLQNPGVTPQQQGAMSSLTAALNQRGAGMPKAGGPLMPNFKRGGIVNAAKLAVKFKER